MSQCGWTVTGKALGSAVLAPSTSPICFLSMEKSEPKSKFNQISENVQKQRRAAKERKKVKLLRRVRLYGSMDRSLPGSSVQRVFQARVLEWGAIAFSRQRKPNNKNIVIKQDKHLYFLLKGHGRHPEPSPESCLIETEALSRWKKLAAW